MLRRPGEWLFKRLGEGCSSTATARVPRGYSRVWGNPAGRDSREYPRGTRAAVP
jgi:hypothetical protein